MRRWDDDDRTRRALSEALAHGPEQQSGEATSSSRSHDDQRRITSLVVEHLRGKAFNRVELGCVELRLGEDVLGDPRQRLVGYLAAACCFQSGIASLYSSIHAMSSS